MWDFSTEPEFEAKLEWMREFMVREVYPLEAVEGVTEEEFDRLLAPLREQVKEQGLWAAHLDPELGGQGFGALQLGLMGEIVGASIFGPMVFGTQAPDAGNAELIAAEGTPDQKDRWLEPLLDGRLKSAFSMTEPHTAGSDPTLLETLAHRVDGGWRIEGRKWFTSNGSAADFLIVMVVTDPEAPPRNRASMLLVPTAAGASRSSATCRPWRTRWASAAASAPAASATPKSPTRASSCPTRTCSARSAPASCSPSGGSARAASSTACAGWARASGASK